MADKEIIIGSGDNVITLLYGTSVKETPDISSNTSTTQTFSGPIIQGSEEIAYDIEIGRLRYEGKEMHKKLSEKLEEMLHIKDNITIIDTVRPAGEPAYSVISNYYNCLVTGNDYEMKPEEYTVENLKFRAEKRKRKWK